MGRFLKYIDEKCSGGYASDTDKKKKKKKMEEDIVDEAFIRAKYSVEFTEDKALWKLVKKYWPNEAKQLEKGYDEHLTNTLIESVGGSISRYGFGDVIKK